MKKTLYIIILSCFMLSCGNKTALNNVSESQSTWLKSIEINDPVEWIVSSTETITQGENISSLNITE